MGGISVTRHCPKCGPRVSVVAGPCREANIHPETIICPTCGMDPAEYAFVERIVALGGAEVYRQEYRAGMGRHLNREG